MNIIEGSIVSILIKSGKVLRGRYKYVHILGYSNYLSIVLDDNTREDINIEKIFNIKNCKNEVLYDNRIHKIELTIE